MTSSINDTVNVKPSHNWFNRLLSTDFVVFIVLMSLLSYFKWTLFSYETPDYTTFLRPWYETLEKGGFNAFKDSFFDYNPLYLYMIWVGSYFKLGGVFTIKIISFVFDFVMAFGVRALVKQYYPNNKYIGYMAAVAAFAFPVIIVNSTLWGQCDVMYSSMLIWTLVFLKKNNLGLAGFFYAIAITLKLQAIFIAPVLIYLLFNKYKNWTVWLRSFAILVLTYVLALIPAFLQGRPWITQDKTVGLLNIYAAQTNVYRKLVAGSTSSYYAWFSDKTYNTFYPSGLLFAAAGILMIYWVVQKLKFSKDDFLQNIVAISLVFNTSIVWLLPKMHERYFFTSEILALVYLFIKPKHWYISFLIIISSLFGQLNWLAGNSEWPFIFEHSWGMMFMAFAVVFILVDLYKTYGFKSTNQLKTQ